MISKPKVISKPSNNRFNYNLGLLFHVSHGTASGTSKDSSDGLASVLDWFDTPDSNASSNYVIAKNGDIYEIVNPELGYTAWANGHVNSANVGNSLLTKTLKTTENINLNTVSIEHVRSHVEMIARTPMPDAQLEASLRLSTWLADRFKFITAEQYLEHADIDNKDRPFCPGFPNFNTYYRLPVLARYKKYLTSQKKVTLNGFTLEGEILQRWLLLESMKLGLPTWGYPVSNAFTALDGKTKQFFEKSTVVYDKTTTGVWRIQSEIIVR